MAGRALGHLGHLGSENGNPPLRARMEKTFGNGVQLPQVPHAQRGAACRLPLRARMSSGEAGAANHNHRAYRMQSARAVGSPGLGIAPARGLHPRVCCDPRYTNPVRGWPDARPRAPSGTDLRPYPRLAGQRGQGSRARARPAPGWPGRAGDIRRLGWQKSWGHGAPRTSVIFGKIRWPDPTSAMLNTNLRAHGQAGVEWAGCATWPGGEDRGSSAPTLGRHTP
jgi:hypothetical protein